MYSQQFMRFLIGRDADDYMPKKEEKKDETPCDSAIYRYTKYATIPLEIKK